MSHAADRAEAYFRQGYNCAQAMALTFSEELKLPPEQAVLTLGALGGGMGRLREVCGAVSVAFLVLGAKYGYNDPENTAAKKALYAREQEYAASFRARHETYVCRELLGSCEEGPQPEERTPEYYEKRPCVGLIRSAAEILETYLAEHPAEGSDAAL